MRIAVYGSAPSSILKGPTRDASYVRFVGGRALLEKHQFPFIQEEWAIWSCSPGTYGVLERIDRFFEVHRWESGQPWFSPEYVSWLRNFNGPVYTGEVVPEIKNSVRLPRERLIAEFGPYLWASSLSYMIAIAILEIEEERRKPGHNPDDDAIAVHGVDMRAQEEYLNQLICCQVLLHEASKRGIKVMLPPESDLMRPYPMYGVCEWTHAHIKGLARKRELDSRLQAATVREQEANNEKWFLRGALDNHDYFMKTWATNDDSLVCVPDASGKQVLYLDKSGVLTTKAEPDFPRLDNEVHPGDESPSNEL